MKPGFSYEEMQAEIKAELDAAMGMDNLDADGPDVLDTHQLCERYGLSWQAAAMRADAAVRDGKFELLHVMRRSADGRMRMVKAYRLITQ